MNFITIGAPSLVLALEPNKERVRGNFMVKIIANALPTGLSVFSTVFLFLFLTRNSGFTPMEYSTITVIITTILMLIYQYKLCKPFNMIRRLLLGTMISIFIIEFLFFRNFFTLATLDFGMMLLAGVFVIIGIILWKCYNSLFDYLSNNNKTFKKLVQ